MQIQSIIGEMLNQHLATVNQRLDTKIDELEKKTQIPSKTAPATDVPKFIMEKKRSEEKKEVKEPVMQQSPQPSDQFNEKVVIRQTEVISTPTASSTPIPPLSRQEESASPAATSSLLSLHGNRGLDVALLDDLFNFFRSYPKDKQECIKRSERARDTIIAGRDAEPPYRVTTSKIFREIIEKLTRDEKQIQKTTIENVLSLIHTLKTHIMAA
jgi:hypothetical protein